MIQKECFILLEFLKQNSHLINFFITAQILIYLNCIYEQFKVVHYLLLNHHLNQLLIQVAFNNINMKKSLE